MVVTYSQTQIAITNYIGIFKLQSHLECLSLDHMDDLEYMLDSDISEDVLVLSTMPTPLFHMIKSLKI